MTEHEVERLVVRLMGDGSSYGQMLDEAEHHTDSTMEHIAHAAGGAALALPLIMMGHQMVEAWEEQEKANIMLEATLEANGREVHHLFEEYSAWAGKMQETTMLADEQALMLIKQAESFQLTGDAAKRAAEDAIALAAINDSNASSMIRITAKMAEGNVAGAMMFARMIPQLRGVKDELEFVSRYQKLVDSGWKVTEAMLHTLGGQVKQLKNAWSDFFEDFGKIIAEAITPFVTGIKIAVNWMKTLSEETKKWITVAGTVAASVGVYAFLHAVEHVIPIFGSLKTIVLGGFSLIGAALAGLPGMLLALLNPMTYLSAGAGALLAIFRGLAFLISPFAIITAGAVALGIVLYQLVPWGALFKPIIQKAGEAVQWFGEQWQKLKDYVGPAIQGIKDALSAGDVVLAVKILTLQIQLAFLEGTLPIQEAWIGLMAMLRRPWIEFKAFFAEGILGMKLLWMDAMDKMQEATVRSAVESARVLLEARGWVAKKIIVIQGIFSGTPRAEIEEQVKAIEDVLKSGGKFLDEKKADALAKLVKPAAEQAKNALGEALLELEKMKQQLLEAADSVTAEQMKAVQDRIDGLKDSLAEMEAKAKAAADAVEKSEPGGGVGKGEKHEYKAPGAFLAGSGGLAALQAEQRSGPLESTAANTKKLTEQQERHLEAVAIMNRRLQDIDDHARERRLLQVNM